MKSSKGRMFVHLVAVPVMAGIVVSNLHLTFGVSLALAFLIGIVNAILIP